MRKGNPRAPLSAKPNDFQSGAGIAGAICGRRQFTFDLLQSTFPLNLSEPRSCHDGYFIFPEHDVFGCCDFVLISLPASA